MDTTLAFASLTELAARLARRELRATELAQLYLARIARLNPRLNAYARVDAESVLRQAEAADARRAAGYTLGPLDGVPIAVKDLLEIEGQPCAAGSAAWADRAAATTATAVRRLLAAGMVVLGRTQMVEFAFGGWGTNPELGTPVNPWDLAVHRIPGGSSSGSGVAVAAGLAPAALGSDTGGSVRIPAALNGVTGLKTTAGLISLHGAVPLSPTLDSIGPLTRDVADAALLTQLMAGTDALDPATRAAPAADYRAALAASADLRGVRIAVLAPEQFPMPVSPAVAASFEAAQSVLRELGATLVVTPLPFDFHEMMLRNGQLIAAEAYAFHRAYIDDESLPLGPWVRARVQRGRDLSAADYLDALAHHRRTCREWSDWMSGQQALLLPAQPFAACPVDEVDEQATPLAAFTRGGNYLGACGLSLPAGFDAGLPLGVQLLGAPFAEAALVRVGRAFQSATDWHRRVPGLG